MIRISVKVMVGVLLSGCTVNNYQTSITSPRIQTTLTSQDIVVVPAQEMERAASSPAATVVVGNTRIRPECDVYRPPAVPTPVRVNLTELEQAKSATEINAIALKNVVALNKQFADYAKFQRKHYADYIERCVIK